MWEQTDKWILLHAREQVHDEGSIIKKCIRQKHRGVACAWWKHRLPKHWSVVEYRVDEMQPNWASLEAQWAQHAPSRSTIAIMRPPEALLPQNSTWETSHVWDLTNIEQVYTPPPIPNVRILRQVYRGGGWGCIYLTTPPRGRNFVVPLFCSPKPRRVFSVVGVYNLKYDLALYHKQFRKKKISCKRIGQASSWLTTACDWAFLIWRFPSFTC